jgi:hypothetical protein
MKIRFLVTPKQNCVSKTLRNGILFPLKTKFRFRITLLYKRQKQGQRGRHNNQIMAMAVKMAFDCSSIGSEDGIQLQW